MPTAISTTAQELSHQRYDAVIDGELTDLHEKQMEFVVKSTPIDLSDASGFSEYTPPGGTTRVYLDDDNFVRGDSTNESWEHPMAIVDNRQGSRKVFSRQDISRRKSVRGFFTRNRAELRDLRGLLYSIRGRQVGFYIANFQPDLRLALGFSAADQAIQVVDTSFNSRIQQRGALRDFRVLLKSGAVLGPFRITGSTAPVGGIETISIAPEVMGSNVAVQDVDRIEFVRKVRFDTDRFEIIHEDANGKAKMYAPIIDDLNED